MDKGKEAQVYMVEEGRGVFLAGNRANKGRRQGDPRKLCLVINEGRGLEGLGGMMEIRQKMQVGATFQHRQSSH